MTDGIDNISVRIYRLDEDNKRPVIRGTGTLFEDKGNYYVLTAYHCLEKRKNGVVIIPLDLEQTKIAFFFQSDPDQQVDVDVIKLVDKDVDKDIESLKNIYENRSIYLLGYPEGMETKVSYGVLDKLYEDRIQHFCSTKDGSSGSPILLSENSKIIGIHFGNPKSKNFEFNCGTFISYPLKKFFNNYKDLNEP